MRTLPQTRTSPISRSRVAATAAAGLALLCLTGAPPPVGTLGGAAPVAATAQRSATDEFSIPDAET